MRRWTEDAHLGLRPELGVDSCVVAVIPRSAWVTDIHRAVPSETIKWLNQTLIFPFVPTTPPAQPPPPTHTRTLLLPVLVGELSNVSIAMSFCLCLSPSLLWVSHLSPNRRENGQFFVELTVISSNRFPFTVMEQNSHSCQHHHVKGVWSIGWGCFHIMAPYNAASLPFTYSSGSPIMFFMKHKLQILLLLWC